MSRNIELYGSIINGKLDIPNRKRLVEELRQAKDCEIVLTIKKRGKRSNPQNSYYWSVIIPELKYRFRELGNDVDDNTVHEFLKLKFNPEKIVTLEGEVIEVGGSTTDLNKSEFSDYCDRIRMWAAQTLDINIPDPNTQTQMFIDNE